MPVINFNQSYPMDLQNLVPPGFNEPDNIQPVPEHETNPNAFDPDNMHKKDLWQQMFLQLKDVDSKNWWANAGKMLTIRRDGKPSAEGFVFEYTYPQNLETPRAFSISGDGTAEPVEFDGSAAVELILSEVIATKIKDARNFAISGAVAATEVSFDGTGNVTLVTQYNEVVPDNKLPGWIAQNFIDQTNALNNLNSLITNVANNAAQKLVVFPSGANITLQASNKDDYVRLTGPGSVTVPPGVFAAGDVIYIRAANGAVTIAAGAGVTITTPYGQNNVMPGTGATVALVCINPNVFDLIGTTQYV